MLSAGDKVFSTDIRSHLSFIDLIIPGPESPRQEIRVFRSVHRSENPSLYSPHRNPLSDDDLDARVSEYSPRRGPPAIKGFLPLGGEGPDEFTER